MWHGSRAVFDPAQGAQEAVEDRDRVRGAAWGCRDGAAGTDNLSALSSLP